MLRIGFVIQSGEHNYKPFRNQPLVSLYLLTIIERNFKKKTELSLIDLRAVDQENIIYRIPENDLYLYSVATPDFTEISNIVNNLRRVYPASKHIAGGPHINIFPDDSLSLFDSIAIGEGEDSIVDLINDFLSGQGKRIYRQIKPVNLDSYPYPSRKYLPKTAVVDSGLLGGQYLHLKGTTVIFSRGCPFGCHFCANRKLMFGPVRYRSAELVKEEIEYLKKEYGIEALALKDDNSIPMDLQIGKSFLQAIASTNIKWRGQSRANGVHPDLVKLAKDSGCVDIAIGIESVSEITLKLINKKINVAKAKEYIALLNKAGISVREHFIIGLPGEPDNIVKKTLEFIEETNPKSVLLSLFCPMPGSEIYDYPEKFGLNLLEKDWRKYHTAFGRFDAQEKPSIVFEYNKNTPWGEGRDKNRIVEDYFELQSIMRNRGLNF